MCLDKRVIAGLVATGGLLFALNPGWFSAALPLLIIAICPLSMLLMIRTQKGGSAASCHTAPSDSGSAEVTALRAQVAELRREVAARGTGPHPACANRSEGSSTDSDET